MVNTNGALSSPSIKAKAITALVIVMIIVPVRADLVTISLKGGAESGEYLMPIRVGTPRQMFDVKVTTADYALMIPSESCTRKSCKTRYNINSATNQKIPCHTSTSCRCPKNANNATECGYQEHFGSSSVKGTVTRDVGEFDNFTIAYTFVRFDQRPPTLTPDSLADGIFGLSQWEPAYSPEHLLPQIANATQRTDNNAFSLCLGEFGGKLILGGQDTQYFTGNLMWVPVVETPSNFTLSMVNLTVGYSLTLSALQNPIHATVDAGTQYLRLPSDIFQTVKTLFHDWMCDSNGVGHPGICGASNQTFFEGNCQVMDDSTIIKFPIIELTFITWDEQPVSLVIPPTNYFVDYRGVACLAIEATSGHNVIIGSRIIQEYYTVFVPSNNTVGFAKAANCSGAQYKAMIVSGNEQRGVVGEKLSHPLVVKVLRLNDSSPVQGVNVSFSVVDTSIPAEAMWISHAIGMSKPARVSTSYVVTSADGTASAFLWLAGSTYETTVSVDIPLCLDHVIFTAVGQQSVVWRVITYLFLGGLVIVVILLNFWYRNAMQKKRFVRSSSSVNNFEEQDLYFIGSPPQSPNVGAPPRSDSGMDRRQGNREGGDIGSIVDVDSDSEENSFQMPVRTWYEAMSVNTLRWQVRRLARRVHNLFNVRNTR